MTEFPNPESDETPETGSTVPAQSVVRELYDIIRQGVPFEEKARDALELGRQYLDVENGHLTRIDPKTEHWEAMVSTDAADGQFPPGLELDLGTTYCRRTLDADGQITLHDAQNLGWANDPAFTTHGLHCYLGTTLVLDGQPYGTVCFVADEPRDEPFRDDETIFAELITRMLERELENEQYETQLTRQTNLATVLNRVLRHNLRNDMAVIRGYTQQMADKLEDDTGGNIALRNIDDLLALSQKARELDRIIATEFERGPIEIVGLVDEIAGEVAQMYPQASISVEYEKEIIAAVFPSFDRAIEELIENAAKHGGESPTVTVTIEAVPNAVEIRIEDDGPGLNDQETQVLRTGAETPLSHGSGLGLWLAHWIVTSQGGSLEASDLGAGTTLTISVPRKPATDAQQQLSKLVRSRDQYQAAFEEARDAMTIINDDARIVDANEEAARIYGEKRRQLLGRSMTEFLPDDYDFETEWREFQAHKEGRDTVTIVGSDGIERRVEYTAMADIIPGKHFIVSRELAPGND